MLETSWLFRCSQILGWYAGMPKVRPTCTNGQLMPETPALSCNWHACGKKAGIPRGLKFCTESPPMQGAQLHTPLTDGLTAWMRTAAQAPPGNDPSQRGNWHRQSRPQSNEPRNRPQARSSLARPPTFTGGYRHMATSRHTDINLGNLSLRWHRSEILETDREGSQVWSGRRTVSGRSTRTSG
jgi:hypothetical protein